MGLIMMFSIPFQILQMQALWSSSAFFGVMKGEWVIFYFVDFVSTDHTE
jgi:hypothetical protein